MPDKEYTPKDDIPLDVDAIREREEKLIEKIENPKTELEYKRKEDNAAEREKTLTPEMKVKNLPIPKSQFSMWIMDSEIIAENQRLYQMRLADAYVNPQFGLLLFAVAFNTWSLIKHGFVEQSNNYQLMEKEFKELEKACQTLGQALAKGGTYTGDWEEYLKFITRLNIVWANVLKVKAALGLSIRFKRKDIAMDILEKHKRNPTDAIETE